MNHIYGFLDILINVVYEATLSIDHIHKWHESSFSRWKCIIISNIAIFTLHFDLLALSPIHVLYFNVRKGNVKWGVTTVSHKSCLHFIPTSENKKSIYREIIQFHHIWKISTYYDIKLLLSMLSITLLIPCNSLWILVL